MTPEELMSIRIREKRKEKGLTMEQLGELVGVQKSAVNKWEHGQVTNIKRNVINMMANMFEVSPIWLMGYDEDNKKVPEFEPEHIELIQIYSSLTAEQKKNVMNMLRSFVNR